MKPLLVSLGVGTLAVCAFAQLPYSTTIQPSSGGTTTSTSSTTTTTARGVASAEGGVGDARFAKRCEEVWSKRRANADIIMCSHSMDTIRDRDVLNDLWARGKAPWAEDR